MCGPGLAATEQVVFDALWVPADATMHGATLTLDAGEHELSFVRDPCSLLTSDDVRSAVGSAVESANLYPPSGMKVPGSGPACSYKVPQTPYSSVTVGIETASMQAFESEIPTDPASLVAPAEVGERAYITGMGDESAIFDAGRSINVGLQHGAGESAVPVLEALGRAAVEAATPDATLRHAAPTERDVVGAGIRGRASMARRERARRHVSARREPPDGL